MNIKTPAATAPARPIPTMKVATFRGSAAAPAAESSSEAVWRNVDDFGDSGFWVMTRVPPTIAAGSCPGEDGAGVRGRGWQADARPRRDTPDHRARERDLLGEVGRLRPQQLLELRHHGRHRQRPVRRILLRAFAQ